MKPIEGNNVEDGEVTERTERKAWFREKTISINRVKVVIFEAPFDAKKEDEVDNTGMRVWPAAQVLALYVLNHPETTRKCEGILELGAGAGVTGLLVAKSCGRPAGVVITDGEHHVLDLTRRNIEANFKEDGRPTCEYLRWGENVDEFKDRFGTFDLIMATDVLYCPEALEPFFMTAKQLLSSKPSAQLLVSHTNRSYVPHYKVRKAGSTCGFKVTDIPLQSIPGCAEMSRATAADPRHPMLQRMQVFRFTLKASVIKGDPSP
ncbi:PREDICTED: protein-lysine N-methyltransferase EEF2KMT-like [Branchiostoma belcheri]|uniref:Protein-lysine N-methyltransferase EEF2KMT-like n=1 Tax=Branchiostoma belcheri TaxID=7741 RepID=A0A6P4ZBU5_BRABE|nr:PREDICTED: protein-lysine N-methyltransferase EEF2KMT-like [Branchiostoma belcheri]